MTWRSPIFDFQSHDWELGITTGNRISQPNHMGTLPRAKHLLRSTSSGLYVEIYEPRSKFHFEILEQTNHLRPHEGSGDKYSFLSFLFTTQVEVYSSQSWCYIRIWLRCAVSSDMMERGG